MKALTNFAAIVAACALASPLNAAPSDPNMAMNMSMSSSMDLNDSMSKEGSGTSWLPGSSPIYASMKMKPSGDMLMLHGAIMPRYTDVGSKRGDRKFDAPNWAMGMFSHPLDKNSQLGIHLMMSADPITEGGYGYPLLFQTGESWHGQPLHDRQHPHDLFDEVSATYSRKISGANSVYLYAADPGEPALGPPTYMHRLLAYDYADAPIGHHWQDATHVTFGVVTSGINFGSKFKLEGSDFTGREPDENRYNFDKPRWDSYSGRVSYSPDDNDAFQVSYGFIKDPEGDGANVDRTTASWIYNDPLGDDSNFTTALIWGRNNLSTEGVTDSFLAEADYQSGKNTLFSRIENIQKSGHELVLPNPYSTLEKYGVGEYTVGYVRDLQHGRGIDTGIGFAVTVDTKPSGLDAFYGSGTPVSFQIYLRLRPSRLRMKMQMTGSGMGGMAMPSSEPPPSSTPPAPSETVRNTSSTPAPLEVAKIDASLASGEAKAGKSQKLLISLIGMDNKPLAGAQISLDIAMTTMDMGTSHPAVKEISNGQYEAAVSFAMQGPWRVTVTATSLKGKTPLTAHFDFAVAQ